jgi:hypothetical protein
VREVRHVYRDPLDRVWLACAARIGFRVQRSAEVYASTDGRGAMTLGTRETLDADDSTAQMVFHEVCHALVEGEDALARPDFGLDNTSERDVPREQACLRLQAHLARRHGLRRFLAPTTDFRGFYDALPADPFTPRDEATVVAARLGAIRARGAPFAPHLDEALAATAAIAREARRFAGGDDLLGVVDDPPGTHPVGLPLGASEGSCGTCAWRVERRGSRCRQADGARVDPTWPACERWEATPDCQPCGACCRAAYHSVTISRRDPFVRVHPELVVRNEGYVEIRRAGDRCAALAGGDGEPYACVVYADRPRPCRDFELGGEHCLTARRRVGMSH